MHSADVGHNQAASPAFLVKVSNFSEYDDVWKWEIWWRESPPLPLPHYFGHPYSGDAARIGRNPSECFNPVVRIKQTPNSKRTRWRILTTFIFRATSTKESKVSWKQRSTSRCGSTLRCRSNSRNLKPMPRRKLGRIQKWQRHSPRNLCTCKSRKYWVGPGARLQTLLLLFREHKDVVKVSGPLHTSITSLKTESDSVSYTFSFIFDWFATKFCRFWKLSLASVSCGIRIPMNAWKHLRKKIWDFLITKLK